RSMRVSGTAAQVENAFKPGLGVYESPEQGQFRGREGEIQIPAELEGLVTGVFGLDQRRVAHRRATAAPALNEPVSPAQLASHYNFPSATGAGQTVAIAEFGGGYFASDLQAFCEKQGTPVPTVTPVSVNGAPILTLAQIQQLPNQERQEQLDDSVEVNMDIQILAGLAPGANLVVYFSTFDEQGWVELINQLIAGTPHEALTMSVSWGLAEDDPDWSPGAVQAINERLQAAAALGITVCVAAGDDGSADQDTDGKAHVDFPGSSPNVLAVGGTMFSDDTDVVWWESPGERTPNGGGATGGGVSTIFARPSWQDVDIKSINTGSIEGRVVPDIAALAGPPLYDLIFMGQDQPNGGTSAATPTWASLLALMASAPTPWKPGFLAPMLYEKTASGQAVGAQGCTDVTSGDNDSSTLGRGYTAGPGFDAVSGWGVPDGTALLRLLSALGN
ncbi:MAG TPA: S53 family peptidase, partial [Solirubrobacteraceae bacterium]|nr:S53 family peptidase [Solirubrobacteraceae bacterium]